MKRFVLLALVVLMLPTEGWAEQWLWTRSTGERKLGEAPPWWGEPGVKRATVEGGFQTPPGEEYWEYKVHAEAGWPGVFGVAGVIAGKATKARTWKDKSVIGSQDQCEAVRATIEDPTKPCQGPFYFRVSE